MLELVMSGNIGLSQLIKTKLRQLKLELSSKSEIELLEIVKKYPRIYKYIPVKPESVSKLAIDLNPMNIDFLSK